jgi:uncharacterized protein (DUF1697 family)
LHHTKAGRVSRAQWPASDAPYAALLRAVILGGHGKLAMRDIVQLCEKAGFAGARTYIARGERGVFLRFRRKDGEGDFGSRMQAFTGALVPVMIRRSGEIEAAWRACPLYEALGNQAALMFLDAAPPRNALDSVTAQVALGVREI